MSNLIDKTSMAGTKSELELFTVPMTQVAVKRSFWSEVHLQNPCTNEGSWTFRIPKDMYYLNLAKNFLYVKFRIVRGDGTVLQHQPPADGADAVDNVGPINLLGKTFIKQAKVYINGRMVSDSSDTYAYKAFLETELNYGWDAKNSQLEAALYEHDTPEHVDTAQNRGWEVRRQRFRHSNYVETMAPLHIDLFQQERFLLNQCELSIDLYKNSDEFCLTTFEPNARYKLEVQQMIWYVKKVKIAENLGMALENMLLTTTCKYPIRRAQITMMHVTENRRTTPLNSLFTKPLPRRLIIGMVNTAAVNGSFTRSPFNFEHFNVSEIKITNGVTTVPSTPYRLDFGHGVFMRAFTQLFEGVGIAGADKGNNITLQSFQNGSSLFVFLLTPDGTDGSHWNLQSEGTTSLDIQFGAPLPAGDVTVVIYAEWDSLIMIDKNRQVFTDYSL